MASVIRETRVSLVYLGIFLVSGCERVPGKAVHQQRCHAALPKKEGVGKVALLGVPPCMETPGGFECVSHVVVINSCHAAGLVLLPRIAKPVLMLLSYSG